MVTPLKYYKKIFFVPLIATHEKMQKRGSEFLTAAGLRLYCTLSHFVHLRMTVLIESPLSCYVCYHKLQQLENMAYRHNRLIFADVTVYNLPH